jgi:hypothetical protein
VVFCFSDDYIDLEFELIILDKELNKLDKNEIYNTVENEKYNNELIKSEGKRISINDKST